jgi:hypothetical protein
MIKILSEIYRKEIDQQVYAASLILNGHCQNRKVCGLLHGAMMFMGILGGEINASFEDICNVGSDYSTRFDERFGSLLCEELRPEGFDPDNPPHICEVLTVESILLAIEFIDELFSVEKQIPSLPDESIAIPVHQSGSTVNDK